MTNSFSLHNLIASNELLTSSALIEKCIQRGIKAANARQLIRRNSSRNGIWRSNLTLQRNQRLFCDSKFLGTESFVRQLAPILMKERPGLHRMLQQLLLRDVVLRPHAEMLLSCPISPQKTRFPSFDEDIAALEEILVCRTESRHTALERFVLPKMFNQLASIKAALKTNVEFQTEIYFTKILIEYFRQQNLISWHGGILADGQRGLIPFNNYPFFAVSFSYLAPLMRWNENRKQSSPTPALFHVSANQCTVWEVEGFLERIARAGANKTSRMNIFGVLAARDFTADAWRNGKRAGLQLINLRQLFGDKAFETIIKFRELLADASGSVNKEGGEPWSDMDAAIQNLKTNPFLADLKSLALEVIAGLLIKYDGWEEVQLNLQVPFNIAGNETEREVDVSGQKESWNKVCIIECKAERGDKPLSGSYVQKFFTETVPAFLKAKCPANKPSICEAQIWTTGVVTNEAQNALSEMSLARYIQPALIGKNQLIESLPKTLGSVERLIETIAEVGNLRQGQKSQVTPQLSS